MDDRGWTGKKILTITVYAGSQKLVDMTDRMLEQLHWSLALGMGSYALEVVAVRNGAVAEIRHPVTHSMAIPENIGFGKAVNAAINEYLDNTHSGVLILNNDLEFPDANWLRALTDEIEPGARYVLSPTTDHTATPEAVALAPKDKDPIRVRQVSAFAWYVPTEMIEAIKPRFGFELFDPEFFAYGEDDYTAAILRKIYGGTPFKVVPRSWVKHLKNQTGAEFHLHGGMKKNVDLLKAKLRANKLK